MFFYNLSDGSTGDARIAKSEKFMQKLETGMWPPKEWASKNIEGTEIPLWIAIDDAFRSNEMIFAL